MVSSVLPKKRMKESELTIMIPQVVELVDTTFIRLTCFCSFFGRIWRHRKDVLKLTNLYYNSMHAEFTGCCSSMRRKTTALTVLPVHTWRYYYCSWQIHTLCLKMHTYFFNISDGMFDMCNHVLVILRKIPDKSNTDWKIKVETFLYSYIS